MRTLLKFIILFSVIIAGFGTSKVFGQPCVPTVAIVQASNSAAVTINAASGGALPYVCINVSATNSTEYIATVTHSSCPQGPGTPTYSITLPGGIELAGTGTNPNTNQISGSVYTSTVRFRSKNDVLCKGRITFTVTYPPATQTCTKADGSVVTLNSPGGSFSTSLDVFKTITAYDALVGPRCVGPGDMVTYSINPKLQCAADGLGVDDITWSLANFGTTTIGGTNTNTGIKTLYRSSDNTSYTFEIPVVFPPASNPNLTFPLDFNVLVGKCPGTFGPNPNMQVHRSAKLTRITSTNQSVSGAVVTLHAANADFGPGGISVAGATENGIILPVCTTSTSQQITLTSQGNVGVSGMVWNWVPAPLGLSGTPTGTGSNTVTWTGNATGNFNVLENAGGVNNTGNCGTAGAQYRVFRYLIPGTPTTLPTTAKYNFISASTTATCFQLNQVVTLTLQNPPTGPYANFIWTAPPSWKIRATPGSGTFVAGPITTTSSVVEIQASAGASNGQASVRTVLPTYVNATSTQWTGASAVDFAVTYPDAAVQLTVPGSSGLAININSDGFENLGNGLLAVAFIPLLNTTPNPCNATDFTYVWEFRGKAFKTGSVNIDADNWTCGTGLIPAAACSLAVPQSNFVGINILQQSVTYSASSAGGVPPAFRVTVRSNTCLKGNSGCYFNQSTWVLPGGFYRKAVSDTSQGGQGDGFKIAPNPPSDDFTILKFDTYTTGRVILIDPLGKTVRSVQVVGNTLKLNTKNLKPGVFSVRFVGKTGTSTQRLIIQ